MRRAARAAQDAPGLFPAPHRGDLAAHRSLLRAGVEVAFSSDLPVSPDPNPWPGIRTAVEDPVNGIDVAAALRGYTVGGAFASFEEIAYDRLAQNGLRGVVFSWPAIQLGFLYTRVRTV